MLHTGWKHVYGMGDFCVIYVAQEVSWLTCCQYKLDRLMAQKICVSYHHAKLLSNDHQERIFPNSRSQDKLLIQLIFFTPKNRS